MSDWSDCIECRYYDSSVDACNCDDKCYIDSVRDFAEWLPQHFDLRFSNNPDVWLDEYFNHTRDKLVVDWQKREENESI